MGCCGCFGFSFVKTTKKVARPSTETSNKTYQEFLLIDNMENEQDVGIHNDGLAGVRNEDDLDLQSPTRRSEQILMYRMQHGSICREFPVRETCSVLRSGDENGNKTINEYVRERKIAAGSYGKVALYRSRLDGTHYAIKAFHKSHLLKLRVAPSETAMTDVLREILIMKVLSHPNMVNLVEVIDDPTVDNLYMVLEYVEGKWAWEDAGPLGEETSRKYLRDIVSGLMYLHTHNIVHGDIKPDNLLVTSSGTIKIGDFSVSKVFEGDNDKLRRSPGTPAFTAPECCLGQSYHGKAADTWAVGVTLYCMVLGEHPFLGETIPDTYEKIVNNPVILPNEMNPLLKDLLEGLLCKDPRKRMSLENAAQHPWIVGEEGTIYQYMCWCKRNCLQRGAHDRNGIDGLDLQS